MRSDDLEELYWGFSPKSLHSQNIKRTGIVFVILYEANEGGGLYVKCRNARVASGEELERALSAHNKLRQNFGKDALPLDYCAGESSQRMYLAETETFWVNYVERDDSGRITEDKRIEVSKSDLLAS